MKSPTQKECFELLRKYGTPQNIIRHSLAVSKVAAYLAERLKSTGEKIDAGAVSAASLLHDIGRSVSGPEEHNIKGSQILRQEGFPHLAEIVRKHRLDFILKPGRLSTWEEKLVYYADKRVNEDEIVTLEERIRFLKNKYTKYAEEIEKTSPLLFRLESEIFRKIGETNKSLKNIK